MRSSLQENLYKNLVDKPNREMFESFNAKTGENLNEIY